MFPHLVCRELASLRPVSGRVFPTARLAGSSLLCQYRR